jgi:hypothetical protein
MTNPEIHVTGRGVTRIVGHMYGRLLPITENGTAPISASTEPGPDPGTPLEEVLGLTNLTENQSVKTKQIAVEYLRLAAADLTKATLARIRYLELGRQYGLTYRELADPLGITEAAARTLLKRNTVAE